jgi:hypothetical protein
MIPRDTAPGTTVRLSRERRMLTGTIRHQTAPPQDPVLFWVDWERGAGNWVPGSDLELAGEEEPAKPAEVVDTLVTTRRDEVIVALRGANDMEELRVVLFQWALNLEREVFEECLWAGTAKKVREEMEGAREKACGEMEKAYQSAPPAQVAAKATKEDRRGWHNGS